MYVLNSVINLMLEKMKNNRYTNWFFAAAVVVAGFSMAACEDEPDKYEVAGGKPTLKYVRVPDPAAAEMCRNLMRFYRWTGDFAVGGLYGEYDLSGR